MFTKIIASTFVACSQTFYFFFRDRRSIFSLEIVDFAYKNRRGFIDHKHKGLSLARSSIFEKKKKRKGCTFVAVQRHQSMGLYRPLYQAILEQYNVICCTATQNQTFSIGEEKLLFSCTNFVD